MSHLPTVPSNKIPNLLRSSTVWMGGLTEVSEKYTLPIFSANQYSEQSNVPEEQKLHQHCCEYIDTGKSYTYLKGYIEEYLLITEALVSIPGKPMWNLCLKTCRCNHIFLKCLSFLFTVYRCATLRYIFLKLQVTTTGPFEATVKKELNFN